MAHTYYFYAEHPVTHVRVFKRTYRAPFVAMALDRLIANLKRNGLRIEDYDWCVTRSDKTREYRSLRQAGHSAEEIFKTRQDFAHPVFDGTDAGIVDWLTHVECTDWDGPATC